MGTMYEVISTYSLILSAITGCVNLLSIATKGTKLDIVEYNKTDLFSFFKLNNTDAYILKSDLKLITGSVTIKYIDKDTNKELFTSESFTNLSLGSYTYNAKTISGYSIYGDNQKTINLTVDNTTIVVTFTYSKILGTIYVKYLDDTSLVEIKATETFNNLDLKSYSYTAASIDNYTLSNESSQTVTLTDSNPIQTVTFKYKKILGTVTVNYVEDNSLKVISTATVFNNLEMGTRSFNAIAIKNYTLVSPASQSVSLTSNNSIQSITFKYKKTSGKVNIKYIDKLAQIEIATEDVFENLSIGSYTYNAKTVDGYSVLGDSSKTITLTEESPTALITFEYDIVYLPLDISKQNEVPYISTYYIKPVVEPGEEVFIDYYITDYYYKEYLEEDYSENFTVTVRIEGQNDKVFRNMKAGDHKVSLGSFTNLGEQKFSILCTDAYGRNSHELFNFFLVRNPIVWNEYVMTEEDLKTYNIKNTDNYEVKKIIDLSALSSKTSATVKAALVDAANKITPDSKTYVCVIADTTGDGTPDNWWAENQVKYASDYDKTAVLQEATNTRIGLQQLLDDKKSAGYNKVKLLPGIYRIDHQKQIYIPTDFTLDMNKAILKLNQFSGSNNLMIDINNCINSHVVNGTIEGDYFSHDYITSPNNSEWLFGISMTGESKYCSYDNITIKDIAGYGCVNGLGYSRDGDLGYTYTASSESRGYLSFSLGDIDRTTGIDIPSTNRTTSALKSIEGYSKIGYLSISVYLGYQGNPCGSWNVVCHFYDINKAFIKSIDSYQYRKVLVPENAKYIRVTILNESYPTNLSIQYFRVPTNCSYKNIFISNCRCIGMATGAMNNLLVENCKFTNSGQSGAKCAFDAEDGWDMMQDCTFKNNNFYNNPNNDFLTCAGHNFIVDSQSNGKIYIWERTRSIVIKNCTNVSITLQSGGKNTIVRHGVYKVYDNELTNGYFANNLCKNIKASGLLEGLLYNSTLSKLALNNSIYTKCTIIVKEKFLGYIKNIVLKDCIFNIDDSFTGRYSLSFNKGHQDDYYFENCIFHGSCDLLNPYASTFKNCIFDDVTIYPNVFANDTDIISFYNCTLNYKADYFIKYSSNSYDKGTFSKIEFNYCSISNIDNNNKPFIYAYAKPNGYCKFINCTINIPPLLTIFSGYSNYIYYIEEYLLEFKNTPLPYTVQLISDSFKTNNNIKINIV